MKKLLQSKKLLCSVLMTMVVFVTSLTASAASNAVWPEFRGPSQNPGITNAKTPTNAGETKESFGLKLTNGWDYSDPIIVGKYIYIVVDNNIKKLDKNTGKTLAEKPLASKIGFYSRMAYGDGKLFIPLGNGKIQCVDATTLESLWISADIPGGKSYQGISPVTYHNGYVYMGVSSGGATDGMFYALSASDDNPSSNNEVKNYTWTYTPGTAKTGYYWAQGAIVGNNIIFGGEGGEVTVHSLTQDKVIDKIEINEAIRSGIQYDKKLHRIYITTKSGNIHSVKVNSDGTFDKASKITTKIGSEITSTPVTYNGRVYVAGGGITSGEGFSVLDANTLKIIYKIDGISSQSSPVLTTAYANAENKNTVYMYVFGYSNPDSIYCIKDFEGNTKPIFEKIGTPSSKNYNTSSAAVDEEGNIFFKNDSKHLFKFENINKDKAVESLINEINALKNVDDITLSDEAAVMRAMQNYNNLSSAEKAKVSNVDKLNRAYDKIKTLKGDMDKEVQGIVDGINSLPGDITLANKPEIENLFARYNALPSEYKANVTNIDKLNAAKKTIEKLEADLNKPVVKPDVKPEVNPDNNNGNNQDNNQGKPSKPSTNVGSTGINDLPQTGGLDTNALMAGGAMLTLVGGALLTKRRK